MAKQEPSPTSVLYVRIANDLKDEIARLSDESGLPNTLVVEHLLCRALNRSSASERLDSLLQPQEPTG